MSSMSLADSAGKETFTPGRLIFFRSESGPPTITFVRMSVSVISVA
jgi:hypothetical protein